jgi:uncharacterized integral membrane protein (TIGR00698 family)
VPIPLHLNAAGRRLRVNQRAGCLLIGCCVTALAFPLGQALPRLGPPAMALLLGLVLGWPGPVARLTPDAAVLGTYALQASVIGLGLTTTVGELRAVGGDVLLVVIGTAVAAGAAMVVFGRLLGVRPGLQLLIGVGTGICGASAIGAVSRIVGAHKRDVTVAITTIFLFNVAAVAAFPPVADAIGLGPSAFAVWAGTAVNDTSSVLAAAYAYGSDVEAQAVTVKLVRVALLLPVACLLAAAIHQPRGGGRTSVSSVGRAVWIVPAFIGAVAVHEVGALGAWFEDAAGDGTVWVTTLALALVGLSGRFGDLAAAGPRPVLLGMAVFVAVAASSLGLQWVGGGL